MLKIDPNIVTQLTASHCTALCSTIHYFILTLILSSWSKLAPPFYLDFLGMAFSLRQRKTDRIRVKHIDFKKLVIKLNK